MVTPGETARDEEWATQNTAPPPEVSHPLYALPPGTDTHLLQPTVAPPTTEISILTLNTHNAGYNSPSLTDMVTLLDLHTPDILLPTETPMHLHQGALTQFLHNRGCKPTIAL